MKVKLLLLTACIFLSAIAYSQTDSSRTETPPSNNMGTFSGSFYSNVNAFIKDSKIGATTPLYTQALSAVEGWFNANYNSKIVNVSLRYDFYHNSNLLQPNEPYTNGGIGYWQINKTIDKLDISIGSIYDQFGSGSIFRAYWEPFIGIDNAIQGVRVIFKPTNNLTIKAISGKQKYRFSSFEPIVKGVNMEQSLSMKHNINATLGAGLVNRTLDKTTMSAIADNINNYELKDRFVPKYNEFAYQGYATVYVKEFTLAMEYAGKTADIVQNATSTQMVNSTGQFMQGNLSWAHTGKRGIGVNLQYRKLNNFEFRISPLENGLTGLVNYLPSITRQNTYRLMARYVAVTQYNDEQTVQGDITYTHNDKNTLQLNGSYVTGINNTQLFHEIYFDWMHQYNDRFKLLLGVQTVMFNQSILQGEPGAKDVYTITPFTELNYDINAKKSLRIEAQYLSTKQDSGSFINVLADFNISPHWSFSAGDMINIIPSSGSDKINYYTLFAAYTEGASRIALAYVKQLAGFNCNGGICRYEPAFNGVKLTISSTF
jgi:hypothetical protein